MYYKKWLSCGVLLFIVSCSWFSPTLEGKWTLVEIRLNDKLLFDIDDDGSLLDSALADHKAQQDRLGEVMTGEDTLIVEEVHKVAIQSYLATYMDFQNDSIYVDKDGKVKKYEYNPKEQWIILNKHDLKEITSDLAFEGSDVMVITETRASTVVRSRWKKVSD